MIFVDLNKVDILEQDLDMVMNEILKEVNLFGKSRTNLECYKENYNIKLERDSTDEYWRVVSIKREEDGNTN